MSDFKYDANTPTSKFTTARLQNDPNLLNIATECHSNAIDHGFPLHEKLPQLVAFMSEVGEWAEAVRKDDISNELEEVVDIVVRILAYAEEHYKGVWPQALLQKMEFNRGRPYKHGKKF